METARRVYLLLPVCGLNSSMYVGYGQLKHALPLRALSHSILEKVHRLLLKWIRSAINMTQAKSQCWQPPKADNQLHCQQYHSWDTVIYNGNTDQKFFLLYYFYWWAARFETAVTQVLLTSLFLPLFFFNIYYGFYSFFALSLVCYIAILSIMFIQRNSLFQIM